MSDYRSDYAGLIQIKLRIIVNKLNWGRRIMEKSNIIKFESKYKGFMSYLRGKKILNQIENMNKSTIRDLVYIYDYDKAILEKAMKYGSNTIHNIEYMIRKGMNVSQIINTGINKCGISVLKDGCEAGIDLLPYIERGWAYDSLMNIVIMSRMGKDYGEFVNDVDFYLAGKGKNKLIEVDEEQRILDYLCGKDIFCKETPPIPTYFILSELPTSGYDSLFEYEKFILNEKNIMELLSNVDFDHYWEAFYDDEDDPSRNVCTDTWFDIRMCYRDLLSFAKSGVRDLEKRCYKGINSEGEGILYIYGRDYRGCDYFVLFNEKNNIDGTQALEYEEN